MVHIKKIFNKKNSFPKKLEIKLPYDPAIPLLGTYPEKTVTQKDTCAPLFTATLFTIARSWKQPRCPLTDEWIKKLWYIDMMKYYSAMKRNKCRLVELRWINLEPVIHNEVGLQQQPGFPVLHLSWSLLKLTSIELAMISNHLVLCRPLLLLSSIFPSIRIFSKELALHIRWLKYRSFSLSTSPSNEYSGLISFRIDWFDLLVVQGTLKSLLQHHSSKASILWSSAFFKVQLSHPYMTIGKTIALTIRTFVSEVICLLFNTLSRCIMAFLPRSKSPSAMIFNHRRSINKSEREKQVSHINPYMWNLEKWCWWTYLQGRNRDTGIENRLTDTAGEGEGGTNWENSIKHTYYDM